MQEAQVSEPGLVTLCKETAEMGSAGTYSPLFRDP